MVDFKTDRVTAEETLQRAELYRPQLQAYSDALSRIMEKPVSQRILYFSGAARKFLCKRCENACICGKYVLSSQLRLWVCHGDK